MHKAQLYRKLYFWLVALLVIFCILLIWNGIQLAPMSDLTLWRAQIWKKYWFLIDGWIRVNFLLGFSGIVPGFLSKSFPFKSIDSTEFSDDRDKGIAFIFMPSTNNRWYGLDQLPSDDIEMHQDGAFVPTDGEIMSRPYGIHLPAGGQDLADDHMFDAVDEIGSDSSSVVSRDLDRH